VLVIDWRYSKPMFFKRFERQALQVWVNSPQRVFDAARVLFVARQVMQYLKSERSIFEMIHMLERSALRTTRPTWKAHRVVRAAQDALWLLGKRGYACLPRSMTVFAVLTSMGYLPVIVTGVARVEGVLKGHAWVELDGQPIPGSGDDLSRQQFSENLRYPVGTPSLQSGPI
jgi:Transglutaminase-like superfamily